MRSKMASNLDIALYDIIFSWVKLLGSCELEGRAIIHFVWTLYLYRHKFWGKGSTDYSLWLLWFKGYTWLETDIDTRISLLLQVKWLDRDLRARCFKGNAGVGNGTSGRTRIVVVPFINYHKYVGKGEQCLLDRQCFCEHEIWHQSPALRASIFLE